MQPLDRTTCEQAFSRLDDYIDRELTPTEMQSVRAHLEICVICAREFQFEGEIVREIRARMQEFSLPMTSLLAKVRSALEQAEHEQNLDFSSQTDCA